MVEKNIEYDVIIAGGGPAGLSSLLWCADLGLSAILLEKEPEIGGQLLHTHNTIKNYLGINAANGRELCDIFLRQISVLKLKRRTGSEIVNADLAQKKVTLSDGTTCSSRAIVIATGVRRRRLMVPGEEEFRARGVLESGVKARNEVSGKTVVIVGGGDAALENAAILSETARKVFIVHRRSEFTARRAFIEKAGTTDNIEVLFNTKISAISGSENVESVDVEDLSGTLSQVKADAVLIRIGVVPNTEWLRGKVRLDGADYIHVDAQCRTNVEGVYAAGDVTSPIVQTVSNAVGHGAVVAKMIAKDIARRT